MHFLEQRCFYHFRERLVLKWNTKNIYFHFMTENDIENASFLRPASSITYSSPENGKQSHNIKPCLRYHVTGIWFTFTAQASSIYIITTYCHTVFCKDINSVLLLQNYNQLEMWANANVMVALLNIGGALCSTPQSLADAHCWSTVQ